MAPKCFPDPTSPPWVSVCPYSATETDAKSRDTKGGWKLAVAREDWESGEGGEGPCERGRNCSPSLTGWDTRACGLQLVYELLWKPCYPEWLQQPGSWKDAERSQTFQTERCRLEDLLSTEHILMQTCVPLPLGSTSFIQDEPAKRIAQSSRINLFYISIFSVEVFKTKWEQRDAREAMDVSEEPFSIHYCFSAACCYLHTWLSSILKWLGFDFYGKAAPFHFTCTFYHLYNF